MIKVFNCKQLFFRKLSLEIVLGEFGKRFYFHFYGDQETNRNSAPEWFFTQIMEWLDKNQAYFELYVQKYFDDVSCDYILKSF